MALGWAAEMAPAGGQEALTALITQRMQMARDAEAVRQHKEEADIQRQRIAEDAKYREATFGAQQADRDITTGVNLGKSQVMGNDVTSIAPALIRGGQGPNMSTPAYPQMPVPAPPPGIADPAQDQNAPLPDGGVTHGGLYRANAPSLTSVEPTKRVTWLGTPDERKAKEAQDRAQAFVRTLPPDSEDALNANFFAQTGHPRPQGGTTTIQTYMLDGKEIEAQRTSKGRVIYQGEDVTDRIAPPPKPQRVTKVEEYDPETNQTTTKYVPTDQVAGQSFQKAPGTAEQRQILAAKTVSQTGQRIIAELQDPDLAAQLGPLAGRYNNVADFYGNPPPEFAKLAGELHGYALASMGVHNMRSAEGAAKLTDFLATKLDPAALAAKIAGLNEFSKTYLANANAGRKPVAATPAPAGGSPPPVADAAHPPLQKDYNGQKYWYDWNAAGNKYVLRK